MPEVNRDSPILYYQSAAPGAETHRPAAIAMLIWSCLLLLTALPLAALTVVGLVGIISYGVCPFAILVVLPGILTYTFISWAISLIRLARRFLTHQSVNVAPLIRTTAVVEGVFYFLSCASLLWLFLSNWLSLIPLTLFPTAAALTYTRRLLNRARFH
jgi:hypothetical protein